MTDTNPTPLVAELLPCPFCGGPGEVHFSYEAGRWDVYEVECLKCDFSLSGPFGFEGDAAKREAIAAWNHRLTAEQAGYARMREALDMCAFQLEQIAAPHMRESVPGALAIQCGIKAEKARAALTQTDSAKGE